MKIAPSSVNTWTTKGPPEWFTGDVYIYTVATSAVPSRAMASLVHFMPGARTASHRHRSDKSLRHRRRRLGPAPRRSRQVIRPGDRIYIEPDEEHWHGATPTRLMVHLALNEVDDDHDAAHWGAHVTDEEYTSTAD
jgi:quercetin dioxygenase-like cupin family protein